MLHISRFRQLMILLACLAGVVFTLPNFFYGRVESHNDAVKLVDAGMSSDQIAADVALWPSFLPSNLVNLGLDLRGGAHLLAEVQVQEAYGATLDAMWPEVRDVLAAERDTVGFVTREESTADALRVRISEAAGIERALELVRGLGQPVATLTGAGASNIVVSAEGQVISIGLSEAEKMASDDRVVKQALEIIRRRIDAAGTREPAIQRQGDNRILIQVPGAKSAQELKDWIGTTAQLTFNSVVGRTTDANANPGVGNILAPSLNEEGSYYILERTPVVTGEELVDAQPSFDQNGLPAVSFRFNPTGARAFGQYTSENVGAPFAIVLDNEVISAPTIRQAITGGSGIISGSFSIEESTNLAVNVAMIFGALSVLGATLTLPGIAGIVLTMGMAVDANVLVFERIREELKTAKGPARAIELGYERAMSAIVDANITTIITAAILWFVGSGPVRGFATTLGIGIVTSVFTALFVTRLFIVWWFQRRRPKTIEV
ncbi:MAG: preprotein translocase subunit SecD [Marivivens sp.]|nr:preprotein translocase subunit SecD [Marivivens sp.]